MAKRHWRKEQGKDRFFRKAKEEGYRARSAYKLAGINRKFRVIRPGYRVLDIGAAPGSWSQLAREIVGEEGHVVAVDLQTMQPLAGVASIQGDIRESKVLERIREAIGGQSFDVVISDIAPKTTGVAITDHARSVELSLWALAVALRLLRNGGNFVTKVFMGEDFDDLLALTRRFFRRATTFDPEATRKESKETFIVATHLHARALLDPDRGLSALLAIQTEDGGREIADID
ncbi:MAG: RlmE family RNA methyltransferase [Ardenticatenaceae bacterium]